METSEVRPSGDPNTLFTVGALRHLATGNVPFLVGGTFAFVRHTKIPRDTKDLDIFLLPEDVHRTLTLFREAGYRAELPYPHWLAKVERNGFFIDLIFSAGNGVARVDEGWFAHAVEDDVLGMRVRLCPPEEMIWSKSFVQERERFDGADVLHLLRETATTLDWPRLLRRFGEHWPVLLSHLVMFRFAYPNRRDAIPSDVIRELVGRLGLQREDPDNRLCYGTLLSREQFLYDIEQLGYLDARVEPHGAMTPGEARIWTEAIEEKE
jgi:hypothetical protein